MECPKCGSSYVIKNGKRQRKAKKVQAYYCNSCGKQFVDEGLKGKTYSAKVVIASLKNYYSGKTLTETSSEVNRRFKVNTSSSTVHNWIEEYRNLCGYSKKREKYGKKYGKGLVKEKTFDHSDLEYRFKYHEAKLKEVGSRFSKLANFVENVDEECPDDLFDEENRSSQMDLNVEREELDLYTTRNRACELAEFALKGNTDRKKRHEQVQDFMLKCDNATFAVEVPVWYYDKKRERSVTGHIDLVQERAGKIFILDYKPKAEEKWPLGQLYSYARGLSYRSEIPLTKLRVAWFNQNLYREFTPSIAEEFLKG